MRAKRGTGGTFLEMSSEKIKGNLALIMDGPNSNSSALIRHYPKVKKQWAFIVQLSFCTLMLQLNFSKICDRSLSLKRNDFGDAISYTTK